MKLLFLLSCSFAADAYGLLCDFLDGQTCTHYQSCSWMNGACQHNNCLQFNVSACDDQEHCHWAGGCGYCVENCNDSTDCFFSGHCKFDVYCKMTAQRNQLGCAIMDTPQPVPEPTYKPTILPTEGPTEAPTTYPFYHDPYGERFNTPLPTAWVVPSELPTKYPSKSPSTNPSHSPTILLSTSPTGSPSRNPTNRASLRPTKNPSHHPSKVPSVRPTRLPPTTALTTNEPTFDTLDYQTYIPSPSPSVLPSPIPSTSPTTNPTYIPSPSPSVLPSPTPSTSPTTNPTNSTGIRPVDDTTLRGSNGTSDGRSGNLTGTSNADTEDTTILMIILPIFGAMFLSMAFFAAILTKKRRRNKKQPALSISIPTPHQIAIDWPISRTIDCTPQKRRSLTHPPLASSSQRPRLLSGISLGEISRGGEPYGDEVEVLIHSSIDTPS